MYYINAVYENTIIINKSRFITHVYPITNACEANFILDSLRKKYYDATHNCYAYIIGDNQEIQKFSDDGEPKGTAGFPILDAIKKNNFTNVLVVVTRYFGGILLGAGGLVRAYSESTSEALKICDKYIKGIFLTTTIPLSYKDYNNFLVFDYINICETIFNTDVIVTIKIRIEDKEKLLKDLNNLLRVSDLNLIFKEESSLLKL